MLRDHEASEVRRIAALAAEARQARDRVFVKAAELELDEPGPPRGEPRPVHRLGLAALRDGEPAVRALRTAIEELPDGMRQKLWIVMRIGSGDYAAADWERARVDAARVPRFAYASELGDEADLHERLMKGLYELGLAEEQPGRQP